MCLTIPGRIEAILTDGHGGRTATIAYGHQHRSASLLYLPEARVGDYVVVQAGYATARLEEADALEALRYAEELAALDHGLRAPSTVAGTPGRGGPGEA